MSLSVITGPAQTNSGTPWTGTFTGTVGTGQVMLVFFQGFTTPTVSDNVNTGNYSLLASYSTPQLSLYYKITNAANGGSTTVTVTGTGYVFAWVFAVTGFVGTPTIDATLGQPTATATSAAPALNMASNFNNEILLMNVGGATQLPVTANITVAGWTAGTANPSSLRSAFYAIEATPTTNNFSGTLTSQQWFLQGAGIYDLPAGPPPIAPYGPMPKQIYIMP